jgi:hypothetical protein
VSPRRDVSSTVCTEEEAQQLTQKLVQSMLDSWHLLREAFVRRAWEVLGYPSWDSYCDDALSTAAFRLSPEWRQQVVAQLSSGAQPMSNRAIGAALGVSEGTVRNDLSRSATAQNYAIAEGDDSSQNATAANAAVEPEQAAADAGASADEDDILDVEIVEDTAEQPQQSRKRLGADGKARSVPPPKPRRKPLIDDVARPFDQLDTVVARVVRLTGDDRFAQNAEQIADHHRHHVIRMRDALEKVLLALPDVVEGDVV